MQVVHIAPREGRAMLWFTLYALASAPLAVLIVLVVIGGARNGDG